MPRRQPTDLILYEKPHYPHNAARAEHFESRAEALDFARHIAALYGARFDRCDLTGADFRGATTDGLTLIDCPADGADFRGAHWED